MHSVAIIIPCYNGGALVEETVASALAQSYPKVDVVVVNDGSTDATTLASLDRVRGLARVTLIDQENAGVSAALNTGVRSTGADFILPLGADDLIDPRYVAEAVDVLSSNPDVGMVYCRAEFIGAESGPWRLPDFDWKLILVHNVIFASMLYRRTDWERAGGYDETMRKGREDHDFVLRMLALGGLPHRLDGVYFQYRRSSDSLNSTFGRDRELLISTSAHILRNNHQLYVDHAEELFTFIFEQTDRIADLGYRYQRFEQLRNRFPGLVNAARRIKRRFR